MTFMLRNAPSIFRWTLSVSLESVKYGSSQIGPNDIVVFLKYRGYEISAIREVLATLDTAGLTVKLKMF